MTIPAPVAMRAGLMFLEMPATHARRAALWLASAARHAERNVEWPTQPPGGDHLGCVRIDGIEVTFALYRRRIGATDAPDRLDRMPALSDEFSTDLGGIAAVLCIETRINAEQDRIAAAQLAAWAAYQAATILEADFIQWRSPNTEFGAEEILTAALPVAEAECPLIGGAPIADETEAQSAGQPDETAAVPARTRPGRSPARARQLAGAKHEIERLDRELREAFGRRRTQGARMIKAGTVPVGVFGWFRLHAPRGAVLPGGTVLCASLADGYGGKVMVLASQFIG